MMNTPNISLSPSEDYRRWRPHERPSEVVVEHWHSIRRRSDAAKHSTTVHRNTRATRVHLVRRHWTSREWNGICEWRILRNISWYEFHSCSSKILPILTDTSDQQFEQRHTHLDHNSYICGWWKFWERRPECRRHALDVSPTSMLLLLGMLHRPLRSLDTYLQGVKGWKFFLLDWVERKATCCAIRLPS